MRAQLAAVDRVQDQEDRRLAKPIDQLGAWLFRAARNRITDLFRRKKPGTLGGPASGVSAEDERWEDEEAASEASRA